MMKDHLLYLVSTDLDVSFIEKIPLRKYLG